MKYVIHFILFLLILFSGTSCMPLLKLVYGVHNPRLETVKSVTEYAKRKELDDGIILIPKDSASFFHILTVFNKAPDLYLFNNEGQALQYTVDGACNAPVFEVTERICEGIYRVNDSLESLSSLLKYLRPLSTEDSVRFQASIKKESKYTSVITWKTYIGYLNKDHARTWLRSLNSQGNCSLNTYLLNTDFIEGIFTPEQFKELDIRIEN